jgi:hypothetical protein
MDMPMAVRVFMLFTSVFMVMVMRMFSLVLVLGPAMIVWFHSLHLTSLAAHPG